MVERSANIESPRDRRLNELVQRATELFHDNLHAQASIVAWIKRALESHQETHRQYIQQAIEFDENPQLEAAFSTEYVESVRRSATNPHYASPARGFYDEAQALFNELDSWQAIPKSDNLPVRDHHFQKIAWLCGLAHKVLPRLIERDRRRIVDDQKHARTGTSTASPEEVQQTIARATEDLRHTQQLYRDIHDFIISLYDQ